MLARASRARISASRAWKTSALTFSRRTPSTAAICSWDSSPSSKRTSAARWSSGRRCSSSTSSRRSARRWTCAAMPSNGPAPAASPSAETCARCAPQRRQAAVAGDRVQPRAQLDVARAAAQRPVGGGEAVLQGVLGLLAAAQHVSAEGEQAAVVAVVDDLEGGVVAGAHASDESIVAHAQQPPPARRLRGPNVDRGGGHRAKYALPGTRNVKAKVPRTSRHGMGGNRPGARDGAPAPVGAVAPGAMHPCTDQGTARSPALRANAPNFGRRPVRRQLPRACSCPGRCPPNAGLIRDRAAQPSCGCPQ